LRPFFTGDEIRAAVAAGLTPELFPTTEGTQIDLVPNPAGEGYVCPAFDTETSHCRIYEVRPLDCRLYPFALMWDAERTHVLLGWDTKCPYMRDAPPEEDMGLILVVILSPFYVGGVFLFSYGYELYNIPRALRLTAIIVFVTLAAVVIVAVLFFLLANMNGSSGSKSSSSNSSKGGKSRSSSSSSSSKPSNSPRPSTGKMGGIVGAAGSALNRSSTNSSSSDSSSSSGYSSGGHVYIGGGETREVTKEVVKEVPKEPMPVTCPFCARSYVPVENNYICPSCGAATPRELIKESQEPK